ncbi:MAG: L-histidine N(alpha)-methyltransferase [Saprospiraceae bacterium]|nr:L-histidine N(alpha)-methyltransferase [Saprospiraceae bacterium]
MSITDLDISLSVFAKDVQTGLSKTPKELSSKYFYDAIGDRLFQDIMNMPEYYLTDAEFDILTNHKNTILSCVKKDAFDMVELGAGDGKKTKILLEHFLAENADFQYRPIDISENALTGLEGALLKLWPQLEVNGVQGDYFVALNKMRLEKQKNKLILFMGANIGNFSKEDALQFLTRLNEEMTKDDFLLIGFDLKKDPQMILDAYNDPAGITSDFNLNLLQRMNNELGANFDLNAFKHWENYNPITGETKSFIVSKENQKVYFACLDQSFHFDAWEAIYVELSQKYSQAEITTLADAAGFKVVENFYDTHQYFTDSLWQVK